MRGTKALCCTRCPSGLVWRERGGNKFDTVCVTPEERDGKPVSKPTKNSGCLIGGIVRKDIADSDCNEARTTGCIRRLLTQQQYANCLAAQKGPKEIYVGGKPRQPKDAGKAKGVASNNVYKQPSGDQSAANKACTMRAGDTASVVSRGPDKWVHLSGISGACGGGSGWVWNAGELVLP